MATEAELGRKFAALMRQSQYVGARPAITGLPDADNDDIAQVEDNANKVWIRFLDGDRQLVDVYHMGRVDTGRSNLYVIVEPTISGDSFQVKGYDPTRGDVQDGNNATPPPAPPIINETTIINQGSLRDLQPYVYPPPASFRLGIRLGYLWNAYFPGDSVYLGDYYPATAGYFNWVKVGIDPTVSPPLIVVGQGVELAPGDPRATQNAAPEQLSAINLGTNVMPIGGILIKDGQTSIRKRFIVDLRVMTNGPSGSGSVLWERTGNVLHPQDLANLVSIGTATGTGQLSVVGADGALVQLRVTGSGAQNIGVPIARFETFGGTQSLVFTDTGEVVLTNTLFGANANLSRVSIQNPSISNIPLEIRTIAAQTANNLRIRTTANDPLFVVDANGAFVANDQGADADSRIEGDNDANLLFVDAGADRIGIGDAVPDARLHIEGRADELQVYVRGHSTQTNNLVLIEANDGTDLLTLNNAGNVAFAGTIQAVSQLEITTTSDISRNRMISISDTNFHSGAYQGIRYRVGPAAVASGDRLMDMSGIGYDGSDIFTGASVRMVTTEAWTGSARGAQMQFLTVANGGTTLTNRMTIQGNGAVSIVGNFAINGATPATPPTWGVPTGTLSRATFATGTVTLAELAQRVAQAIIDLRAYGIFA